jgi:hypothetical protein
MIGSLERRRASSAAPRLLLAGCVPFYRARRDVSSSITT